ncbi:MAG TPA: PH domain-containing protein [Gaiellaceae bacterium]|jgi:membrane protein YdbS with pleckstrin-like domain|nr:PH domain-containing protein [Gaiellaceae bacterium]
MLAQSEEHVLLDARRHGVVLVRPLGRALLLALLGVSAFLGGFPVSVAGALLLVVAAVVATAGVWRWDRTHVVLTDEKLFVVHGVVRKRAAAVRLAKIGTLEIDQSFAGRLLGYGTIVAGELEIRCVARPRDVYGLVQRLNAS